MGKISQLFFIIMLLIAPNLASAAWGDQHNIAKPQVSGMAVSVQQKVDALPDKLFMDDADHAKVDELLATILYQIEVDSQDFAQSLRKYRLSGDAETWLRSQSLYLTLHSFSQSKQDLLKLADSNVRQKLTGFGPDGVTQFKAELQLTKLNGQFLIYFQLQSFKAFIKDLSISPVPVIVLLIKLFFVHLLFNWWLRNSKKIIEHFRKTKLELMTPPTIWVRLFWYLSKANRPIAWLIALTISLRILAGLPSLQHLIFLEIFTWWILGGAIAIKFILEFVYRNSRSTTPAIVAIRLSTIRYYVWSVIGAGVILQISARTIGEGTIYNWIYSLLSLWFICITILVLRRWKPYVFSDNHENLDHPVWVTWAINKKSTFGLSTIAAGMMTLWLILRNCKQYIIASLSQYAFFSQILAYLFRIEVAKQTDGSNNNLVRIRGNEVFEYILPGSENSELIPYAIDELKQLSRYILTDSPAMCVVSGERGIGTTTFLKQMAHKAKNATAIYLNCPNSGYTELLANLAQEIGLSGEATEIQILSTLRKSEQCYIFLVDNGQRLVKPMVGGLSDLLKFTNLIRRSKKNHRCLLAIEKSSWRFVDRARGERLLFDLVTFLPRWSEANIAQLLTSRLATSVEHPVSFDGLVVPKQWDQDDISEEERARIGFFRILWHYADGNPTVALRFFRLSLRRDKVTNDVVVRLFNAPSSEELEKMPKPMLAILRSIVQLEVSSPEELSECTQLSIAEVIGSLRFFQSRGYIEWSDDKARISDHWYRYITNALHRQHLLVK